VFVYVNIFYIFGATFMVNKDEYILPSSLVNYFDHRSQNVLPTASFYFSNCCNMEHIVIRK